MSEFDPFTVPLIVRAICYGSGMAVYLGTTRWMVRAAAGKPNAFNLHRTATVWAARVLGACMALSIVYQVFSGIAAAHPGYLAPEAAILLLLAAYGCTNVTERPAKVMKRIPVQAAKAAGVTVLSFFGCWMALAAGIKVLHFGMWAGLPPSLALFLLGLLFCAPYFLYYREARRKGAIPGVKPPQIMVPLIFACLLLLLPELFGAIGNSPKIHEMLHPAQRLGRV